MKNATRLMTACLLACLMSPQPALAGGDRGQDPYDTGRKLFARKNYGTALKYFEKALKRDDVRAHYGMGLVYEDTGRERDALRQYLRFIELAQPEDTEHGDALQRVSAIEERLKKTRIAPPIDHLERGRSLMKAGKYREAEKALLEAASRNESRPEIHFHLGEVYLQLEEYGKAKSEYDKAKRYY